MSSSSPPRFFITPKEPMTLEVNAHAELLSCLDEITTQNPPVPTGPTEWKLHGLYEGPTSIAYLFYRLSLLYPDLKLKSQSLAVWAEAYLDIGASFHMRGPTPRDCGIANERLAHTALRAVLLSDKSLARKLCSYEDVVNDSSDTEGGGDGSDSNEWLYGRAGYLYFLRLCRTASVFRETRGTLRLLDYAVDRTVARILSAPQPWRWHGKEYLGAAHGTVGIICQVVLSRPSAASDQEMERLLTTLLSQQYNDTGNFPSSLPVGTDKLVQFCHGGPGFVMSLRSLRPHFPNLQDAIQSSIQKAQEDIWRRGVLTKEPCLCHGAAGNALALDDDCEFRHFIALMSSDSMGRMGWDGRESGKGDVSSLFKGAAGRAWVWAVADKKLPRNCIAYNDL